MTMQKFGSGILQADGTHADDPIIRLLQLEEMYYALYGEYPAVNFIMLINL